MGRVSRLIQQAREVLQIEAQGVLDLIERIGPEFEQAVEMIIKSKGRVIFTGIGKSGIVGRKIMATLNSTGTPSLFLHPVEAVHGDLGVVTTDDIIIAISNEFNTPIRYIGIGESFDDLRQFKAREFVDALLDEV